MCDASTETKNLHVEVWVRPNRKINPWIEAELILRIQRAVASTPLGNGIMVKHGHGKENAVSHCGGIRLFHTYQL